MAPQTVDDLKRTWLARGVEVSVFEREDSIRLSRIVLPKDLRGKGVGTLCMEELAAYADRKSKVVLLSPSTDFGASSVARLQRFYARFGFEKNSGRKKDFRYSETMIRRVGT